MQRVLEAVSTGCECGYQRRMHVCTTIRFGVLKMDIVEGKRSQKGAPWRCTMTNDGPPLQVMSAMIAWDHSCGLSAIHELGKGELESAAHPEIARSPVGPPRPLQKLLEAAGRLHLGPDCP